MKRTAILGALLALCAPAPARAADAILSGPWVQKVDQRSAIVRVEVAPGTAPLRLEVEGGKAFASSGAGELQSFVVNGLEPGTAYTYRVLASAGSFTTAPGDGSTAPFTFLVYGDNRSDESAHAAVVHAMESAPGDFLVHTGDFVANGGSRSDWRAFFRIEAPLLRQRPIFSCVGNHELIDGSGIAYMRYFGPGDAPVPDAVPTEGLAPDALDGTFRWADTRFFLLNGMVSYRSGTSRAWLERALAAADSESGLTWRVLVVHHSPWSSGPHGGNARLLDAGVPDMLRQHHVDLVIAGHDHIYERGKALGIGYLISGGGGAPLYEVRLPLPSAKKIEAVRHFISFRVTPDAMELVTTRVDGSTLERCGLRKVIGWDCDGDAPPAMTSAPADAGPPPALATPSPSPSPAAPSPAPASRCGCRVAGDDRSWPFGVFVAAAVLLAARRSKRAILAACAARS